MTLQELWSLLNFYKSVFSGEQIDEAIGVILNGGIDAAVDAAEASAAAAAQSAKEAAGSAAGLGDAATNAKNSATQAAESAEQARIYAEQAHAIAGEGLVFSVNNVQADETGNVPLGADSVGAIPVGEKGAAGGVAELDDEGKVPAEQIPSNKVVTSLSSIGWYRVARFSGNSYGSQALLMLGSSYRNSSPMGVSALVTANKYQPGITILHTSGLSVFSALRLVSDGDNTILEAKYNRAAANSAAATLYVGDVTYKTNIVNFEPSTATEADVIMEQAIGSVPSGNVLTDGGFGYDLLWENAAKASAFAAQSIEVDTSDYDYLMFVSSYNIFGAFSTQVQVVRLNAAGVGDSVFTLVVDYTTSENALIRRYRKVTVPATRKTIIFSSAYTDGTAVSDTYVITHYIYGIKGVYNP